MHSHGKIQNLQKNVQCRVSLLPPAPSPRFPSRRQPPYPPRDRTSKFTVWDSNFCKYTENKCQDTEALWGRTPHGASDGTGLTSWRRGCPEWWWDISFRQEPVFHCMEQNYSVLLLPSPKYGEVGVRGTLGRRAPVAARMLGTLSCPTAGPSGL